MPERHFTRQEHASVADFLATLAAGARATAQRRGLVVLATATLLTGFASEVVDRLDIRRLEALGLGGSVDAVVVVAAIGSLEATIAAVVLFGARRRLHTSSLPAALGLLYAVSGVAIAALGLVASLPVAAVALVLQGGLRTATEPIVTAWTNTEAPSAQRATVHSFIGQADSVGQITGGILLGVVAEVASVPTALTMSAALFVIAAAVPVGSGRVLSARRADRRAVLSGRRGGSR
jgi:DHA3 family tetracycline resistance protein-like MFS transporter